MGNKEDQLCWSCTNACGACSWSAELLPVKGWTARVVPREWSRVETTYAITACPLYVKEPARKKVKRDTSAACVPTACVATCLETGEVRHYKSMHAAGKDGFHVGSVALVINGERAKHRGWKFERMV